MQELTEIGLKLSGDFDRPLSRLDNCHFHQKVYSIASAKRILVETQVSDMSSDSDFFESGGQIPQYAELYLYIIVHSFSNLKPSPTVVLLVG